MSTAFVRQLVDAASAPYRAAGRTAWHFARGKLTHDPVFRGFLAHGLVPDQARILDLGCGRGLLAAWLAGAARRHGNGDWPADWPTPPRVAGYHGIELSAADVAVAEKVLAAPWCVRQGDIRRADFGGSANVVVLLDVLHYIDHGAQEALLARIRDALTPGGRLLLRVSDASRGLGFRFSTWVDRLVVLARGFGLGSLYCRALSDWKALLEGLGFRIQCLPMSQGTPFANTLIVAFADQKEGKER